jgi:putative membrane protein
MSSSTLTSAVAASDGWDGPGAWWPVFPLLWLLVIAAIVATFVVVGRRRSRFGAARAGESRLAERYAAGEIDDVEYRERLTVLREQSR